MPVGKTLARARRFAAAVQQRFRSRDEGNHQSGSELIDCVRMVHLQQNASQYVTRVEQRKEVAADLRAIFKAPGRVEAERLLQVVVKKYAESAPRLSAWMEANVYQGLTVMSFPGEHQKRLRTTNLNERVNRELKRRTRVVGIFPNAAALERLATAVLMEMDEDWQSGLRDLSFP